MAGKDATGVWGVQTGKQLCLYLGQVKGADVRFRRAVEKDEWIGTREPHGIASIRRRRWG